MHDFNHYFIYTLCMHYICIHSRILYIDMYLLFVYALYMLHCCIYTLCIRRCDSVNMGDHIPQSDMMGSFSNSNGQYGYSDRTAPPPEIPPRSPARASYSMPTSSAPSPIHPPDGANNTQGMSSSTTQIRSSVLLC